MSLEKVIYTASADEVIFSGSFSALKLRMQYILLSVGIYGQSKKEGMCFDEHK